MSKIVISVKKVITAEMIDDLLVSCLEGGSNYWIGKLQVKDGNYKGTDYASHCVSKGGTLLITPEEAVIGDEIVTYELNQATFVKGITAYIKNTDDLSFFNDYDGGTADSILQYALFNEVVFS
jgi:hypothetical protein